MSEANLVVETMARDIAHHFVFRADTHKMAGVELRAFAENVCRSQIEALHKAGFHIYGCRHDSHPGA